MEEVILEEIRQMIKEGDLEEAQGYLAQMLIDNPKNEKAWLLMAEIVPPDQAKESLERVLEINPDNNEARLRLAHLISPPTEEEQVTEEEMATSSDEEQKPHTLEKEDYDLDDLIKSLEEKPDILPAIEPDMLQTTPGTTLNEEESFLAALLDESPPEPTVTIESEPVSIDDGSFFALPGQEETPVEEAPAEEASVEELPALEIPEPATEEVIESAAVPLETLPEQITQIVPQDFSVAEEKPAEKKEEPKPRKKGRRKRGVISTFIIVLISLCVIVTGGFSWYYFYGPCGVENVIAADQKIANLLARWDITMMVTTNSSRVVLAEPLGRLVEIRQELNDLEMPVCMTTARDSLDRSMLYTLEAYDKLFNYENDLEITKRFNMAKTHRKIFEEQMDLVRHCAPLFCP